MAEGKPIILKFHKTNYVHFTTKKNMSANLKMGFHKILSPIAPTKKFLGLRMNNTLSWSNHIDWLMEKLIRATYIIRNAKT